MLIIFFKTLDLQYHEKKQYRTPRPNGDGAGFEAVFLILLFRKERKQQPSTEFGKHFVNCVPQNIGSVRCTVLGPGGEKAK